jgi:hypothetical protein
VTVIEIRPYRNGWKCFEAPGVEPVFLNQEDAIDYATGRACFRSGEIRILDCDRAPHLLSYGQLVNDHNNDNVSS